MTMGSFFNRYQFGLDLITKYPVLKKTSPKTLKRCKNILYNTLNCFTLEQLVYFYTLSCDRVEPYPETVTYILEKHDVSNIIHKIMIKRGTIDEFCTAVYNQKLCSNRYDYDNTVNYSGLLEIAKTNGMSWLTKETHDILMKNDTSYRTHFHMTHLKDGQKYLFIFSYYDYERSNHEIVIAKTVEEAKGKIKRSWIIEGDRYGMRIEEITDDLVFSL